MQLRRLVIVVAGILLLGGALVGLRLATRSADTGGTPTGATAVPDRSAGPAPTGLAAPGGTTAPGQPSAEPSAEPSRPAAPPVTYAGRVDGGAAAIAIAVRNGQAIAYVCDGRRLEAWLQGPAGDGQLALTGKNGAALTGTHDGAFAAGTVTVGTRTFTFRVKQVAAPAGLYRLADKVADAAANGGWIVADGEQTGTLTVNGVTGPAPPLDTATGEVVVNGVAVRPGRL